MEHIRTPKVALANISSYLQKDVNTVRSSAYCYSVVQFISSLCSHVMLAFHFNRIENCRCRQHLVSDVRSINELFLLLTGIALHYSLNMCIHYDRIPQGETRITFKFIGLLVYIALFV